jgi:Nucleotide-diphospho-sugar transferase
MTAGVVLVATGAEKYVDLAARAAASVKRCCPGLPVDLYTDRAQDLPVFDRVHVLDDPWFRSKIDALIDARFERTLYMDADILALADFRDVFALLERFDIALAHDWYRNSPLHHSFWRKELPPAFPQFNGGLIALRRTAATTTFLQAWRAAVQATDTGRDQISLRELLWDSDLRIATLPEEYNLLWIHGVRSWTTDFAAPRLIHSPNFHREYARYARARDPAAARLGLVAAAKLPSLIAADRGLARLRSAPPAEIPPGDRAWMRRALADLPRRLAGRLRRLAGR